MKRTQYLYGVPPSYFNDMNVFEASEEKIRLAKKIILEIWEEPLETRDLNKSRLLQNAIAFHEYILTEDEEYKET